MADDVDLWEHLRHDDTVPMDVDDDELAAALAGRRVADEQSVDDLLAEIEAFANDGDADDEPGDGDEAGAPGPVAGDGGGERGDDTGPRARVIAIGRKAEEVGTPDDGDRDGDDPDPDASVMHDRMRARRIAVRREEGLRRLRRLAWVLGAVTALVVGAATAQTPFFDVDRIEVRGSEHVGVETLRWASGVHTGDALLTMDEHGAEEAIEALPWVAEADVRREWPNTVRISVTERSPAALVAGASGTPRATVDADGRVLQIGGPLPADLVTVTDLPVELHEGEPLPEVGRDALDLALTASARLPGAVRSVSPDLEAELAAGGVARFGSLDRLDEKLQSLATVLARVDMRCADVLDVKVPGSATVSRRPC